MKLLLPMLLPLLAGIWILVSKSMKTNQKLLNGTTIAVLAANVLLTFWAIMGDTTITVCSFTELLTVKFSVDAISRLFVVLTAVVWLLVGIYATAYMQHEHEQSRFFGFYLILEGVLVGLDFSANVITMYTCFELMTITSLPLVLHERTKEAVMAGLKYLFYSVAGAFLALFGIFVLASIGGDLTFTAGGVLQAGSVLGKEGLLLAAVCCMLIGFGAKAGMFPLHGWLPTAHPVAPAPASAVLSGVITKFGVLAIIRVVYFIVGPDMIRGTWVQTTWMVLSLITVFMGSMLAYKEKVFKKRLAYSTVSQVSYVLFGLSLLEPAGFVGALSHVVFHSMIKNCLFLVAGAIILKTGWTRVEEMRGHGRILPMTLTCYTAATLALIGIPPFSGFVSKWYLATGSLASGTGVLAVIGPVVLLLSALLTAGYLLPIMINGFFPGEDFDGAGLKKSKGAELPLTMLVPIVILALAALGFGCFPGKLIEMLQTIAASVL